MTKQIRKSNLWKVTLALLVVALVVSVTVGAVSLSNLSGNAEEANYVIDSAAVKTLDEDYVAYSDLSPEQIKDLLVVTGHDENAADKTPANLDPSLYDVYIETADGKLSVGTGNNVSVAIKGSSNKTSVEGFADIDVQLATALDASLAVPGYVRESSGYYRNSDGFYAFTQGMDEETVKSRLGVSVKYPNSEVVLPLNDANITVSNITIGNTGATDSTEERLSVTVNVTFSYDSLTDKSITATYEFRRLEYGALALKDGTSVNPTGLTSATVATAENLGLTGKVTAVYNNGLPVMDASNAPVNVPMEDLDFSSVSFAPSGNALTGAESSYQKTIEIKYRGTSGSNVAPLVLKDLEVSYAGPYSISTEIGGRLSTQTARSTLDLSGLYLNVQYRSDDGVVNSQVNLNELDPSWFTITYYNYDKNTKVYNDLGKLTTNVNRIKIVCKFSYTNYQSKTVEYISETDNMFAFDVTVNAKPIARPVLQDYELTYDDSGCSTTLSGIHTEDPSDDMSFVVHDSASDRTPSAYASYSNGKLEFKRGGEFYVTATLKDGSDFRFDEDGRPNESYSNNHVTFKVIVRKAPVQISVSGITDRDEIEYGADNEPTVNVIGKVAEPSTMGFTATNDLKKADFDEADKESNADRTTAAPDFILHYTGTIAATGGTYDSFKFPTQRGTYSVTAKTAETAWYQAGETSAAVSFTIIKRQIELDANLLKPVTYDNTEYTLTKIYEQISTDGFAAGDTATGVLTAAFASGVASVRHAGTYGINLTIINDNYKWKGVSNENADKEEYKKKPTNFVINKKDVSISFVQGHNYSYTYGDGITEVTVDDSGLVINAEQSLKLGFAVAYAKGGTSYAVADSATWDVGTYTATYSLTGFGTGETDVHASDVNFVGDKTREYSITPRSIKQVKLDKTSSEYNNGDQIFKLINNDGTELKADALVNGQTYADILTVTLNSATLKADGTTAVATARMSYSDCVFTAIDAADYTYKVALNSNYTWHGTPNADGLEEITLTFEITQAPIEIKWAEKDGDTAEDWDSKTITYTYDGNAHYPVLFAQEGLTLSYHFAYSDGSQTVTVEKEDIKDARTYWARVTGFTGKALTGASYTLAVNYSCSATEQAPLDKSFVIVSQGLEIPALIESEKVSGNLVTVVYNGSAVDFTSFIDDYSNKYLLNGTPKITITFDDSTVSPKNVKGTDVTEGEYIVKVTPRRQL